MHIIQNNPYRTVGLLVGATAREQERQVKRLKQFIEAEQDPQDDFSFPTLGNLHRTLDKVNEAASKLNLDSDKMSSALFWFYKGNPITDEPAFDAIKEADLDQVINIWTKLTSNGEVSQRNASAYSNLGTLYLSGILEGTNTNEAILEQGISLKLKFLESDFIKDFKALATDETYKTTKKELQLLFLNQVQSEVEKSGTVTSNKFLDILTKQEFSAKEDFLKGFVQKPIEQIEKRVEESKSKRKANKANSIKAANTLLAETKDSIKQLKSILGATNIKYASIADKLAMEFFACGRDYFMHFKDTDTDPSDYSMKLFKNAKSYAVGNIAKQQIDENIKDLQEWIDDKPERDKQKLIGEDLKFITSKLERFQNLNDTIANAKDLVESCKPKLFNIRTSLGRTDDFYLKISGAVVNNVQGMLVTVVNDEQELFQFAVNPSSANIQKIAEIAVRRNGANRANATDALTNLLTDRYTATENLKTAIRGAVAVSRTLGELDMDSQLKTRYNTNNSTLLSLASQLGIGSSSSSSSTSTYRPTTSSSSSSDEGIPDWLKWVGGIILFIILIKACN
ncbi:MAG: hypothetical protein KIPDCIKN_04429 [Haliscomenobacter sp.]|nr:hypothetical protein [Haliscomenobacter sp.]